MKFGRIKEDIYDLIGNSYEIESNEEFEEEFFSLADECLENKTIFRIKRSGINVKSWKTLVFVEIESENEQDIRLKLKHAISWIASTKQILTGTENSDVYLFIAFSNHVSLEECLRIESTEQICRKYVLLPGEEISEFLNRTFLQKLERNSESVDGQEPMERAFSKTAAKYCWLSQEMQISWKKAFMELSGSELVDSLLSKELPK